MSKSGGGKKRVSNADRVIRNRLSVLDRATGQKFDVNTAETLKVVSDRIFGVEKDIKLLDVKLNRSLRSSKKV